MRGGMADGRPLNDGVTSLESLPVVAAVAWSIS